MKRFIILLVCVIANMTLLSAQNIIGTWFYEQGKGKMLFKFKEGNKGLLQFEMKEELAPGSYVVLVTKTNLTYAFEGEKSLMFKINYEGVKTEYDVILTEQTKENVRQNGYTEEELRKLLASARDEYHSKVKSNLPLMMPAVSAYQIVYMRQNVIEMQGKNGQNPVRLKRERP